MVDISAASPNLSCEPRDGLALQSEHFASLDLRETRSESVRLYSIQTSAEVLGIAQITLRALVRDGKLPHCRVARRILIRSDDLASFIDANTHGRAK